MADKKTIQDPELLNYFEEELKAIDEEIKDTDNLYNELKEHFDGVKKSRSTGALNFISKQTPNLISAKSNKISLLKDKVALKKIVLDVSIKLNGNDDDNNARDNMLLKMASQLLLENNSKKFTEMYQVDNTSGDEPEEVDYDKLLAERLGEKEVETIPEEKHDFDYYKRNSKTKLLYSYVYNIEETTIYAIDEDHNILDEETLPTDWIITIDEDAGFAYNQYGDSLPLVEFD